MKNMNRTAFARVGIDASNESISLLIDGIDLMLRKGLSTRSTLRTLMVVSEKKGMNSIMPTITTKKSSQFHGSRIYAFLCSIKP